MRKKKNNKKRKKCRKLRKGEKKNDDRKEDKSIRKFQSYIMRDKSNFQYLTNTKKMKCKIKYYKILELKKMMPKRSAKRHTKLKTKRHRNQTRM